MRVVWTWLDRGFVAVAARAPTTGLGRHLMSVHLGPKKRPAASTWPCLPAAANLSATTLGRMDLPPVDLGPTLGTQAPPVQLSGQVGELAAELGVGWTEEGYSPPGVAPDTVRHPQSQRESVETPRTGSRCVAVERKQRSVGRRMLTPLVRSTYCAWE